MQSFEVLAIHQAVCCVAVFAAVGGCGIFRVQFQAPGRHTSNAVHGSSAV